MSRFRTALDILETDYSTPVGKESEESKEPRISNSWSNFATRGPFTLSPEQESSWNTAMLRAGEVASSKPSSTVKRMTPTMLRSAKDGKSDAETMLSVLDKEEVGSCLKL